MSGKTTDIMVAPQLVTFIDIFPFLSSYTPISSPSCLANAVIKKEKEKKKKETEKVETRAIF